MYMKRPFAILISILFSLCSLAQAPSPIAPTSAEVFLLGTLHNRHFDPAANYSLMDLRNEVEALHPDLICGEITPEAYKGPVEGYFPPEAAYLAEIAPTLNARFVASDWRITYAWQFRAEAMEPKKVKSRVAKLSKKILAEMNTETTPSLFDYLHSTFIPLVDRQFEEVIGENTVADIAAGGWHERNRRIVENCLDASQGARRIVIAYGASHLPQLRRQLAAQGIQAKIAPRLFTPSGVGFVPESVLDRWRINRDNLAAIHEGRLSVSRDWQDKINNSNRIKDLDEALKASGGEHVSAQPAP